MSISSTNRKAGPYNGNGSVTAFAFSFKVFSTSDVQVVQTSTSGVETTLVLGTNYTVSLNSNQDSNPGGTVTTVVAPASGEKLTITSAIGNLQPVTLTNQGGFYPAVINDALDRATILIQQLAEKASRAATIPISSSASPNLPLPAAGQYIGWDGTASSLTNLAGPASQTVSSAMAPVVGAASLAAARSNMSAAGISDTQSLTNKTLAAATNDVEARYGPNGSPFSWRNKIINGAQKIDQRNAGGSVTVTAGAALQYVIDRFYAYCTGANTTFQQYTPASNQKRARFTGAASVTLVGYGHRIEAANCMDLAGLTATLQVKASSSSLTTLNWAAYYANSTDAFGTLASPTRTSINSGSWTITSTEATYSVQIAIPSAATTGIEIVFTGGALLGSQTLTLGDIQLEQSAILTPFENRPIGTELHLCQRYYQKIAYPDFYLASVAALTQMYGPPIAFKTTMRATPTITLPASTNQGYTSGGAFSTPGTWTTQTVNTDFFNINVSSSGGYVGNTATASAELP